MPSPSRRESSRSSPARDVSSISVNCTFTTTCPKWTSLRDVRYRVPPYPSARSPPGTLRIARARKECTRSSGTRWGPIASSASMAGRPYVARRTRVAPASVSSAAARSVAAIASRRAGPSSVGASTAGVGSPRSRSTRCTFRRYRRPHGRRIRRTTEGPTEPRLRTLRSRCVVSTAVLAYGGRVPYPAQ